MEEVHDVECETVPFVTYGRINATHTLHKFNVLFIAAVGYSNCINKKINVSNLRMVL